MKSHLPVAIIAMIEDGTWPGECLMVTGNLIARPTAAEIAQNYVFLKPIVMVSPHKATLLVYWWCVSLCAGLMGCCRSCIVLLLLFVVASVEFSGFVSMGVGLERLAWAILFFCLLSMQVPSAYFLTDAYLYLDLLLQKKLFKAKVAERETRHDLAGREGVKAKRLIGALRFLWRSSQDGGHDARVRDLKSLLLPSPRRVPQHAVA